MAIIKFVNTKPSLKKLIEYVSNVEKTGYISGKDCMAISCYEEMIATKMLYKKEDGRQQLHLIQSFDIKDKVEPKLAHDIGMELAKYFKGHQVLVATHTDKKHIHNHLVINSVNFENGKKINLSKKDLEKIKEYSNKLCKEKDLSVIETKSKVKDFKQNEYRVALKGESWKFKLINAIDYSMERSRNKYQFIDQMNRLGYGVNWSKNRKHITYITPENMKCRDIRLHETKYLKEEMEKYYGRFKEQKFNTMIENRYIAIKDDILEHILDKMEENLYLVTSMEKDIWEKIKSIDMTKTSEYITEKLEIKLQKMVQEKLNMKEEKIQKKTKIIYLLAGVIIALIIVLFIHCLVK